jgi:hypothetical protein
MKHAAFKASYSDWKLVKTRACVQIIFEVPLEKANEAYKILGGMPVAATESWFAIARLKESSVVDDAAPASPPSPSHAPAGAIPNRLTKRAGMLASDALFQKYLNECTNSVNYTGASDLSAMYIRHHCNVESRKDIRPGTEAAAWFDRLESSFVAWRDKDAFVEP